ncbi:MAG: preprotein translocase subunit SecG [Gammaproteobacteria bacterium]|nr:preprotein translocase subunit SecG [Gammaproteobacteria bacterium]
METLQATLLIVQVFVAIGLIAIILIQHGKGADAGAAFGSGASSTVFGSRGSGNFMTRATTFLAVMFLANSLTLGYLAANKPENISLMEQAAQQAEEDSADAPAVPADRRDDSDMPAIPAQ